MNSAPRLLSPLARQFGGCLARLDPHADAAVLAAAWLACEAVEAGHVCVDLRDVAGQRRWADGIAPGVLLPALEVWETALRASKLVGGPGDHAPLILDQRHRLYLARYWHYEQRLAGDLLARAAAVGEEIDAARLAADLDLLFAANSGEQPDWQKLAAEMAVRRGLCVISGGPGTGKTTTVVRLLAALQMQFGGRLTIRLAAPTGKAAARMQEALRAAKGGLALPADILAAIPEQAATLHRLLGARPDSGRLRHRRDNPLPLDVLVVDEASMIDLALMAKLVDALPSSARLILLGDKDQLASVEAGAVFGDICAGGEGGLAGCIALLRRSYRFAAGGGIGRLAAAVRDGATDAALAVLESGDPEVEWESDDVDGSLKRRVMEGYRGYLAAVNSGAGPVELFARFAGFRVLCAQRDGAAGVAGINSLVESGLRRGSVREPWYHGRPLMVTRNDYNLMLFNGDIGIVAERDGEKRVFFQDADGTFRDFAPGWLPEHETVFAMTVHKSQGSEFDQVLLVLPEQASALVNRALIYTAVTRARHRIVVHGQRNVVIQGIAGEVARTSGLRDKLQETAGREG